MNQSAAYDLLAIDVDDTLIGPDLAVRPASAAAIRAAVAHGVRVVLATGRMFRSAKPYAEALGLAGPIIAYNGAMVRELNGETWFERPVPLPEALAVQAYAARQRLTLNVFIDDALFVEAINADVDYYMSIAGVTAETVGPLAPFLQTQAAAGKRPTKLLIVAAAEAVPGHIAGLQADLGGALEVMRSKPRYIEIIAPGVSKAVALAAVAERFGVSQPRIMAIGDSGNDVPMLAYAGLGVAMGHGSETAKQAADYVTGSHEDEGLANAIGRFIL